MADKTSRSEGEMLLDVRCRNIFFKPWLRVGGRGRTSCGYGVITMEELIAKTSLRNCIMALASAVSFAKVFCYRGGTFLGGGDLQSHSALSASFEMADPSHNPLVAILAFCDRWTYLKPRRATHYQIGRTRKGATMVEQALCSYEVL